MTRTPVPAPDQPATSTAALAAITGPSGIPVAIDIDLLRPHPANPRRDLGDLTELADSIRAHGVRQNLLVVPNPDEPGAYRVVIGHRRTAAARLADKASLLAVVDDTLTPAEQLELMLLENIQRSDLSAVEEADAYQGLLDLGLDEAAIANRTGRSRATVKARLRLRSLPAPAQEKVHTHQATLDDASKLLEFTEHPDVLADLTEQLGSRDFAHLAQRASNEISRAKAEAVVREQLAAAGVKVLDREGYNLPAGVKALDSLTNSANAGYGKGKAIDPEKHATCPGHVAWITPYAIPEPVYGCKDWKKHGHHDRYDYGGHDSGSRSGPMTDDEKAERARLIANNKAAIAAETVRRAWLNDFLSSMRMPADAVQYVARLVRPGTSVDYRESTIVDELLYRDKAVSTRDRAADLALSGDRALRHLVALAAGRVEASMVKDYWRSQDADRVTHLQQLAAWGYPLADVEQEYLDAAAARTAAA